MAKVLHLNKNAFYLGEGALAFLLKEPWNVIKYKRVSRLSRQLGRNASKGMRMAPPIVFFNASARLSGLSLNASFSLLASWAIRLTGRRVVHFVCHSGLKPCLLGTKTDKPGLPPPCAGCVAQSRRLYSGAEIWWFTNRCREEFPLELDKLPVGALAKLEFKSLPLGVLVLPSVRWILRRHTLGDDPFTRQIFCAYIESAWQVAEEFTRMVAELRPQTVVVFNGMFYPEAVVRHLAQAKGLRVVTHEVGFQPLSAFFTEGEATAYPIDLPKSFSLEPWQGKKLDHYFAERLEGRFVMAGIRFWPTMTPLAGSIRERLASFKRVVPVFTNVVFDTSQVHANGVFSDMFDWLTQILEIIPQHPETLFVIRAHPDEYRRGKRSRETVADWLIYHMPRDSTNVVFINANNKTSSYALIRLANLVLVYNSTIGLEAAMMGKAVVCGGKTQYAQYDTVYCPESRSAFLNLTRHLLSAESVTIPENFQINSRRFMYYQHFCASLPFSDYLQEDPAWPGYVQLKDFPWGQFSPSRSYTLQAIVQGITAGESFVLGG